jgi:colanic acid biosynthesis glycosyl transferase WcaI
MAYGQQAASFPSKAPLTDQRGFMPSALVLYHYLYPDDVVSSIHMSELCAGLAERGWKVTAAPCNRGCRDESKTYGSTTWQGVELRRVWRPPFRQASMFGRLINACWMIARWSWLACSFRPRPDVVVIGTDPIFAVLAAIPWKLIRGTAVAHWCFDLYPECAIGGGMFAPRSRLVTVLRKITAVAYRHCDLIVDLGECMRRHFGKFSIAARQSTILPWALVEPSAPAPVNVEERQALFDGARLALLYSGNFGLAHESRNTLALARKLRDTGTKLVFSIRGNQESALRSSVTAADTNIEFVPFASESQLPARLSSADVHVVSLRQSWTGAVVPSKFFGALAIGRPVLFEGSEDCSIARWIREYQVGWALGPHNVDAVAAELLALAESPQQMAALRRRCHALYQQKFSRLHGIHEWDEALRLVTSATVEHVQELASSRRKPVRQRDLPTGGQPRNVA